ncbi:esterase-like activity of phytase family protein [Pelagibacterium mangrovi]|uniref:esterase-like activity of phytase family protein n=1 Tax=Pelagibacterium mangrovi TaxID=3119828 RepID=UPI002FC88B56
MRSLYSILPSIAILASAANAQELAAPVFLDEVVLPTELAIAGVPFGGISGLDYDAENDVFYAISDDRAQNGPARFYVIKLAVEDGEIARLDIVSTHELTDEDGASFPEGGVDPEAIRFSAETGTLFWSSEGDADGNPAIYEANLDGSAIRRIEVPAAYLPDAESKGIYGNLAFENLALSTDGPRIFVGTENGLAQDGDKATVDAGSPARVAVFDRESGDLFAEYIYQTDPIRVPSTEEPHYNDNGLSEFLMLDDNRLIAVERTFASGYGNEIAFYVASWDEADDIAGSETIEGQDVAAMNKQHWFTIGEGDFGLDVDNIESITWGPDVDGERTIVIASDNNFNRVGQFTQFVLFSVPGL